MSIKDDILAIMPNRISLNEPMKRHTSLKTGGPADIFITPHNDTELLSALKLCKKYSVSPIIIGAGSNILVSDQGLRNIVIQLLGNFQNFSLVSNLDDTSVKVFAGAGLLNSRFINSLVDNSLGGMEFLATIPGRVGGAVVMNAGAFGKETSESILSVTYIDTITLEFKKIKKKNCEFSYRKSVFHDKIVTGVFFQVIRQDPEISKKKIKEFRDIRGNTQPLNAPNAGSIFKNPPGLFAAKLIESAGLKNLSVGDAIVSEKHANFIINKGNASSEDVYHLIQIIQKTVFERFAVQLEPEVKYIGDFSYTSVFFGF